MELMKKFIIFKQGVLEELPLQLGVFPLWDYLWDNGY